MVLNYCIGEAKSLVQFLKAGKSEVLYHIRHNNFKLFDFTPFSLILRSI